MDPRTILPDLRELAVGGGLPGSPPQRPWILRRLGLPLLLMGTLLLGMGAVSSVHSGGWEGQFVAFAGVVPLALLWYRPLVAWRIAAGVAVLSEFTAASDSSAWPWAPVSIPVYLVVLFGVAATQRTVVTTGVWATSCGLVMWQATAENVPGLIIFLTVVALIGDQVRRRRRAQRDLRSAEERGAALAERTRIARELHDVVAHHMSMIAVRAETARYRLPDLAEPVRDEFGQISAAAREGLADMRRILGVLRSENQETLTAPQPGLADLADLVETARGAGATITLDPLDDADGVPPAVELTAYRLVQEALSNAGRHAPGAPVSVTLTRVHNGLDVSVRNGPTDRPPTDTGRQEAGAARTEEGGERSDPNDEGRWRLRRPRGPRERSERIEQGHGLRGMRERAAMLDGELTAGPAADGGFEVHAVLPLTEGTG